ncbi:unnamed protein product, partial [Owenia fusiformis]
SIGQSAQKIKMKHISFLTQITVLSAIIGCISCGKDDNKVTVINENNWSDILKDEWFVEFYAPWCPACRQLEETWDKVAGWQKDFSVTIAKSDITENPSLSGRFLITALPTIYHVKDGVFRQYKGERSEHALITFLDEKKYEMLEPIAWYWSPSSPQMAVVGMLFKAAMIIRNIHTTMTETYGVPEWGSYVLFGIATICAGLVLGLLLVCLCDCMCPPRPSYRPPQEYFANPDKRHKDTSSEESEEGTDDDLLDDTAESTTRKRQPSKMDSL